MYKADIRWDGVSNPCSYSTEAQTLGHRSHAGLRREETQLKFIVWTYVTARANILIDSDGGYKNVVVAIDPKIPESKIASHLKELEIRILRTLGMLMWDQVCLLTVLTAKPDTEYPPCTWSVAP
ncbi:hypothetical protein AVEN_191578-1 [Araneus ventricosus]|uniref:Uncharacterized protein n=1 Tax=Araneus ventricosus TaxID=182803 RepID=A0A4Y2N5M0_ARAVE|nr:hypothetical protein AVEN_191578-1 [Araneus ventricosus]